MIKAVLSFSGGKDSIFALHKLKQQGLQVKCLITTIWNGNGETVAHGEKKESVKWQANQLGLPLEFIHTDFNEYTEDYKRRLVEIKQAYKVDAIAFGDIYLIGHREWGEALAKSVGLDALYPLWTKQEFAIDLLREYVAAGYKSRIIKVDENKLPKEWMNREIDDAFINDILKYNVCPLGESGEYHTYVYDGPIFREAISQS